MKLLSDVTEDGCMCAFVNETSLTVYDLVNKQLIFSSKKSKFFPAQIKIVKISPCKQVVACLQESASPHQLTLFFMKSQLSEGIKPADDYFFENILFSSDGHFLAAFSNLSIFTDIYGLKEGQVSLIVTINGARLDCSSCPLAGFSYDGEYFMSVDILKQEDLIKIYSVKDSSWDCVKSIAVSTCSGIAWCQDSASFLVWSLRFSTLHLVTLDGRVEKSLKPLNPVSTVALSNCGRFAAVYYVNDKIDILDLLTWQLVTKRKMIHCPVIYESSAKFRLREREEDSGAITMCDTVTTSSLELGFNETTEHLKPKLAFSFDSKLLATQAPPYPGALWVWDLTADLPLLSIVLLRDDNVIGDIVWHSECHRLAAGTNKNLLLLWSDGEVKILNTSKKPWPLLPKSYFLLVS